jgi:hypothetical protein
MIWLQTPTVLWLGERNYSYFSQPLNVNGVSDVRQREIQTAEPLVPEQSAFEFEITIGKLKRHRSPDFDPIPAEIEEWTRSKFR